MIAGCLALAIIGTLVCGYYAFIFFLHQRVKKLFTEDEFAFELKCRGCGHIHTGSSVGWAENMRFFSKKTNVPMQKQCCPNCAKSEWQELLNLKEVGKHYAKHKTKGWYVILTLKTAFFMILCMFVLLTILHYGAVA